MRPFSWFCSCLLMLFSHLYVASPSLTSSASVVFVLLFTFPAQIFFPFSFCRCALLWFLAACFPLLSVMSPPVLLSIWSCLPLCQCFVVEYLCFPSLSCMAPLKLMFFGLLAVGSSCCHFFSGTKQSSLERKLRLGRI